MLVCDKAYSAAIVSLLLSISAVCGSIYMVKHGIDLQQPYKDFSSKFDIKANCKFNASITPTYEPVGHGWMMRVSSVTVLAEKKKIYAVLDFYYPDHRMGVTLTTKKLNSTYEYFANPNGFICFTDGHTATYKYGGSPPHYDEGANIIGWGIALVLISFGVCLGFANYLCVFRHLCCNGEKKYHAPTPYRAVSVHALETSLI